MSGKTKIILVFCQCIFMLIIVGIFSYRNTLEFRSASSWATKTQLIISEAQKILSNVQDIESAQRGFVITGEEKYLDPYIQGLAQINTNSLLLARLLNDKPSQRQLLDSIQQIIDKKIAFTKQLVTTRKRQNFEAAQRIMATERGENLMKKLRSSVHQFINNENSTLALQLANTEYNYTRTITIVILNLLLTLFIIGLTMYFFVEDYNKRMRTEKKLKEYEHFFYYSHDLACIANFNGYFEVINTNWEIVLGYSKKELLANEFLSFIHPDDVESTDKELEKLRKGSSTIHFLNRYRKKNGTYIWLDWHAAPDPKSGKIYGIARDVTEQKRLYQELREAKQNAEKSGNLKETFLANMSHEIRTPMNAIIGFTELLLRRSLPEQEKEYVQIIKNSGQNLLRIIDDILDVSKINSGLLAFEQLPIKISKILGSLNTMLGQKAKEKNLLLTFESSGEIPETVLGDPTRLTQIIINLVGNAIKFTKEGSVRVEANLQKEDGDNYYIEFSVTDTGIGIAPDQLEHIFDRFRQADTNTTRSYGGTGLGLSIAKQMIELQGGQIEVTSEVDKGSVFTFTLPFKKINSTQNNGSDKNIKQKLSDLSDKKILVAEDNPINIKFVSSLFNEYNISAEFAKTGKEAVEKLRNGSFDIVLMDIEMPEMNGYEATKVLREELNSNVPIIAMTAHAMAGESEKCLKSGMDAYISKPISSELLFETMLLLLSAERPHHQIDQPLPKITNLQFLKKSMRDNQQVIDETLDLFLKQIPEDLAELKIAIGEEDYSSIKKITHSMKSSVSVMGISIMLPILEKMESMSVGETSLDQISTQFSRLSNLCNQAFEEIVKEKNK
jgi:PAS domain S-box-containing protein